MWILIAGVVGVALCCLGLFPIVHHLIFGLRERRREILEYFNDKAIKLYFQRYYRGDVECLDSESTRRLTELYNQRFGRRTFVLPTAIYTLALVLSVAGVVAIAFEQIAGLSLPNFEGKARVGWALAGAYLWVISDLLGRYRRRDLVPSALYDAAFRFAVAVPIVFSITLVLLSTTGNNLVTKENGQLIGNGVAFMLGTFPTNTLLLIMRRYVAQKLALGPDKEAERYELEDLQGVNTSLAERFSDIGITTFLQLAFEDPIQLTMRMNLPFRVTLDLMSQALFALYFAVPEPAAPGGSAGSAGSQTTKQERDSALRRLDVARRYLIRGSIDAGSLCDQLMQKKKSDEQARAQAIIDAIASDIHLSPLIVKQIFSEIGDDPANEFLNALPF